MDVELDQLYQQSGNIWDKFHVIQNQLTETENREDFEVKLEEMKQYYTQNVQQNDSAIWALHQARDAVQSQRDSLEQKSFVEELKGESDYRALFVQRLTAEITAEKAKAANATGDDADIEIAMANAAAAYFEEGLAEQQIYAADALEEYKEIKLRFDTSVARYEERKAIQEEENFIQAAYASINSDYFIVDILHQ